MRILLTGANGFIGAQLTAALGVAGHEVVAAVRNPVAFNYRFPLVKCVAVDLNRDVQAEDWLPRLDAIEAVINCAGILQGGRGQSIEAIHYAAPSALFDACVQAGVRRVIQISAISADPEAGTQYARTKRQADDYLRTLDLDWIVLRPSLVYAEGSYGGTSLLRALSAMPFCIPMVGDGGQRFQPIHVDDLATTVLNCLTAVPQRTLDPVGPETLTFRDILQKYRAWLGLRPVPVMRVPVPLVAALCRVGDSLGAGPMRTTSLRQILYGNAGDAEAFRGAMGFTPRRLDEALAAHPSQTQDLWQARLFLLRPLITMVLFLLWAGSGLLGLVAPTDAARLIVARLGLSPSFALPLQMGGSLLDLVVAFCLFYDRNSRRTGLLQLLVIVLYTTALSAILPGLWLDPFGPLLKNLPIIILVMVWVILRVER